MYHSTYMSPLGMITIASDGDALVGLWIEGQRYHGGEEFIGLIKKDDARVIRKTKTWLDRYFAGKRPKISELPLSPIGSEFRQAVWKILCEIPYGKTVTYGDIARRIAAETNKERISGQAVGNAVGRNPISIIIPCHRVIGAGGNLTGYAGGIDKKIKLLEHEGADMSQFFIPLNGTAV